MHEVTGCYVRRTRLRKQSKGAAWKTVLRSLILVGILAIGVGGVGQIAEDFESALRINLPFSGNFDISSDEDADYFAFRIPASRHGMVISIDIDADSLGSELDSYITIYDETGYEIGYDDDTDGSDPALTGALIEGLYYIAVQGYSGSRGSYTLRADASPIEPVTIGVPYSGVSGISAEGEVDFFVFEASDTQYGLTLTIDIDAEATGSDLDSIVYLYDDKWQGIDYDDDTDGADPYLMARVTQGTYYIVVEAYYGAIGPYTLSVDTSPIEPQVVTLPYSVQAKIAQAYESDFYYLELRSEATIVIDIAAEAIGSDLDSYLYLYDRQWTEIERNDDTDGSDSYIELPLEPGVYFIEVKGYSDSTGDYTLTAEEL